MPTVPISATPGQASWWRDCSLASQWQGVLESHHTTAEQKEFIQWLKHPSFAVKKAMWPLKRDMLNYFPIFFHCITGLIISSLGPPSTRRKEGDRSCERALEGKQHVAGHGLGGIWVVFAVVVVAAAAGGGVLPLKVEVFISESFRRPIGREHFRPLFLGRFWC